MTKKEFEKRFFKCSKNNILNYLWNRPDHEKMLRTIELYDYDERSNQLLNEMERLGKISADMGKVTTAQEKMMWMENHKEWEKTISDLNELEKYHDNLR